MTLVTVGSDLRGEVSIGTDRKRGGQMDRTSIFKATSKCSDTDRSSERSHKDTGAFCPGLETRTWPRDLEMGEGGTDIYIYTALLWQSKVTPPNAGNNTVLPLSCRHWQPKSEHMEEKSKFWAAGRRIKPR